MVQLVHAKKFSTVLSEEMIAQSFSKQKIVLSNGLTALRGA